MIITFTYALLLPNEVHNPNLNIMNWYVVKLAAGRFDYQTGHAVLVYGSIYIYIYYNTCSCCLVTIKIK